MVVLSIIILSYNTKELTIQCIDAIIQQYKGQLENGTFELIVVDNASSDGTVEAIRDLNSKMIENKQACSLVILENKENVGFSRGNNIGVRQAGGKYLFFLNSDSKILDRGLLRMVKFLDQNKSIGILGARLINEDGSPQKSAGSFYNLINSLLMLLGLERFGLLRTSPKKIAPVDWVSGAAMMVRKDVFERLQGFDERFFMYVEDMEFCFRAAKEAVETYFYPDISIAHKTLGSSNRTFAILSIYKGLLYFYQKHRPFWEFLLLRLMLKIKAAIALCIGTLTNNSNLKETYAKAFQLV